MHRLTLILVSFLIIIGIAFAAYFIFTARKSHIVESLNYVDITLSENGSQIITDWSQKPIRIDVQPLREESLNSEYYITVDSLGISPYIASKIYPEGNIEVLVASSASSLDLDDDFVLSRILAQQIFITILAQKNSVPTNQSEDLLQFYSSFREEYQDVDIIIVERTSP